MSTEHPDGDEAHWLLAAGAWRAQRLLARTIRDALNVHETDGLLDKEWNALQRFAEVAQVLASVHDTLDPHDGCAAHEDPGVFSTPDEPTDPESKET